MEVGVRPEEETHIWLYIQCYMIFFPLLTIVLFHFNHERWAREVVAVDVVIAYKNVMQGTHWEGSYFLSGVRHVAHLMQGCNNSLAVARAWYQAT